MASAGPSDKQAATRLPELAGWVGEIAELTKPDAVVWCDGSQAEWDRLTSLLVESGTFTRLNPELRPNSFWCASDPSDVARVEDRTFICSEREQDAGPTNNWIAPEEMRKTFAEIFDGMDLVEPGVVSITRWRPDDTSSGEPEEIDQFGAVARKR